MAADQPPPQTGVTGALTDGTGVSPFTVPKIVKDTVADFLISAAAAIGAANIVGVQDAINAPNIAVFAITGAAIHALYRAALRWSTSDA